MAGQERISIFFGPFSSDRAATDADAWIDLAPGRFCGLFRVASSGLGLVTCGDEDSRGEPFPAAIALFASEDLAAATTPARARRFWVASPDARRLDAAAEHDLTGDGVVDLVVGTTDGLFVIPGPLL